MKKMVCLTGVLLLFAGLGSGCRAGARHTPAQDPASVEHE